MKRDITIGKKKDILKINNKIIENEEISLIIIGYNDVFMGDRKKYDFIIEDNNKKGFIPFSLLLDEEHTELYGIDDDIIGYTYELYVYSKYIKNNYSINISFLQDDIISFALKIPTKNDKTLCENKFHKLKQFKTNN